MALSILTEKSGCGKNAITSDWKRPIALGLNSETSGFEKKVGAACLEWRVASVWWHGLRLCHTDKHKSVLDVPYMPQIGAKEQVCPLKGWRKELPSNGRPHLTMVGHAFHRVCRDCQQGLNAAFGNATLVKTL